MEFGGNLAAGRGGSGRLNFCSGFLDDGAIHGFGVRGLFERFAKIFFMERFGDAGEGVEVFLELSLRHEEEHGEVDRLIIERFEIDPLRGASENSHHVADQIGGGMGNADAEADSGAHGCFAFADDGGDGVAIFGFNFAGGDQVGDQFVNRFPAGGGLEVGDDLLGFQNIGQIHKCAENHFA